MKFIIPIINDIKTEYYFTTSHQRFIIYTPVNQYRYVISSKLNTTRSKPINRTVSYATMQTNTTNATSSTTAASNTKTAAPAIGKTTSSNMTSAAPAIGNATSSNMTSAAPPSNQTNMLSSSDAFTLNSRGAALSDFGRYAEAIPYYDKALAIDPNYKAALTGKG